MKNQFTNRTCHLLLLLFCSLLLSLGSSKPAYATENSTEQSDTGTGRIAGRVVENGTNYPLENVEVLPYKIEEDGSLHPLRHLTAISDKAGAYQIIDLPPGLYRVRFRDLNGYLAFHYHAQQIVVENGKTNQGIDATLNNGSQITGYAVLFDGTPVAQSLSSIIANKNSPDLILHGSLILYYDNGSDWELIATLSLQDGEARFDMATSRFRFDGLAPGDYKISYEVYHKSTIPFQGMYDQAVDIDDAKTIHITDINIYDIELVVGDTRTLGSIRGRVTDALGTPLAGIVVEAYQYFGHQSNTVVRDTWTDDKGEYELRELKSAGYAVRFFDPNKQYGTHYVEQISLETGEQIEEINVLMQPGSTLTGKIRLSDGQLANLGNLDSQILLFQTSLTSQFPLAATIYPHVDETVFDPATSQYTVTGLGEGVYLLQAVGGTGDAYLESKVSIPAATVTHLDIIVDTNPPYGGAVSGVVRNHLGNPLAGIQVFLTKVSEGPPTLEISLATSLASVTTNDDGQYHISSQVPVGDYWLLFYDPTGTYAYDFIFQRIAVLNESQQVWLQPTGDLQGRIVIANERQSSTEELPQLAFTLELNNPFQSVAPYHSSGAALTLDPDHKSWSGDYVVKHLEPGSYTLCVEVSLRDDQNEMQRSTQCYYNINISTGNSTPYDLQLAYPTSENQKVLALYALALDNDPDRFDNLAPQLVPAMQNIITATTGQPNKTAVVLVDAAGNNDTRIYVVRNGHAVPLHGLPNAAFQLDAALTEFNMADGASLGNFIRWARDTYPAEVTLFGFVGHGAPLVPANGFAGMADASGIVRPSTANHLFPLPSRVDTYPSLTDNHPEALITPHALAIALRIGSYEGSRPLQIADIAHCFSASIEELYELSPNSQQPYVEIILASPTYTYLDPPALGKALAAIDSRLTPARMAESILQSYDEQIYQADLSDGDEDIEHPRLLVAVNSRRLAHVKILWDEVSAQLLQSFDSDLIRQAYLASPKYDTTYCNNDWELAAPDALSDLSGFAQALVNRTYNEKWGTINFAAALALHELEQNTILFRIHRNGIPWFAPSGTQPWNFDEHKGISIFTDFQGITTPQSNRVELSWQSRWYTADPLDGDNPYPFAFVQNSQQSATWANVFAKFWQQETSVQIQTALCFPELTANPQLAELQLQSLIYPVPDTVAVGVPMQLAAAVTTDRSIVKPAIRFHLYDSQQQLVFSETVQAGYWIAGTYQVDASRHYTPTQPGIMTLEVTVDPDQQFVEANEQDNQQSRQFSVAPAGVQPILIQAALQQPQPFVHTSNVPLQVQITPAGISYELEIHLYQYQAAHIQTALDAAWKPMFSSLQRVKLLDGTTPSLALYELAGPVIAHVWARTADGKYSQKPAMIEFNYAPPNQPITAGQSHFYRLLANTHQQSLALNVASGEADLYGWSAFNQWGADWSSTQSGADWLALAPTGEYRDLIVSVFAPASTNAISQYTVALQTGTSNRGGGMPDNGSSTNPDSNTPDSNTDVRESLLPTLRPIFQPPAVAAPGTLPEFQIHRVFMPVIQN